MFIAFIIYPRMNNWTLRCLQHTKTQHWRRESYQIYKQSFNFVKIIQALCHQQAIGCLLWLLRYICTVFWIFKPPIFIHTHAWKHFWIHGTRFACMSKASGWLGFVLNLARFACSLKAQGFAVLHWIWADLLGLAKQREGDMLLVYGLGRNSSAQTWWHFSRGA